MQINISITEFINSFGEVKNSLFQNTLKYLYNADSQNGLYVFKSPLGSGKSVLRNLLLFYRISKLTTNPSSEYYAIDFFDENISLAQNSILDFLNHSNLFTELSLYILMCKDILTVTNQIFCFIGCSNLQC